MQPSRRTKASPSAAKMLSSLVRELLCLPRRYEGLRSFISILESPLLKQFCETFDCEKLSSDIRTVMGNTSKPLITRVREATTISAPMDHFITKKMYFDFQIPSLK